MSDSRRHTIASYVASTALAPGTRAALARLGYQLQPAVSRGRWEDASWPADIRLVDERHVARVPRDATPVVVLCGDAERRFDNERIVGVVARPAKLDALYPIFQTALEETPRRAPRAETRLAARGMLADRRFDADVVTLSEQGAKLETALDLPAGARINLGFPLPCCDTLTLRARVCHHAAGQTTVEFVEAPSGIRQAIGDYVQRRLATA